MIDILLRKILPVYLADSAAVIRPGDQTMARISLSRIIR